LGRVAGKITLLPITVDASFQLPFRNPPARQLHYTLFPFKFPYHATYMVPNLKRRGTQDSSSGVALDRQTTAKSGSEEFDHAYLYHLDTQTTRDIGNGLDKSRTRESRLTVESHENRRSLSDDKDVEVQGERLETLESLEPELPKDVNLVRSIPHMRCSMHTDHW